MPSPPVTEVLQDARGSYRRLREHYRVLDGRIEEQVPGWDPEDQFSALLAQISVDTALLMVGADRHYTEIECHAFNAIFDLQEPHETITDLAARLQEQRPGSAELFSRLNRFLGALSIAERASGQELIEPTLDFLRTLAQVIALIDNDLHPDEIRFREQLNDFLRDPAILPEGTALRLKLRDGSRQNWP